jgi:glutaredoxin 3
LLKDNEIAYQELDVSKDRAARDEMINKTEQIGVPVIEIDNELAVGYDEKWLKNKLEIPEKPPESNA